MAIGLLGSCSRAASTNSIYTLEIHYSSDVSTLPYLVADVEGKAINIAVDTGIRGTKLQEDFVASNSFLVDHRRSQKEGIESIHDVRFGFLGTELTYSNQAVAVQTVEFLSTLDIGGAMDLRPIGDKGCVLADFQTNRIDVFFKSTPEQKCPIELPTNIVTTLNLGRHYLVEGILPNGDTGTFFIDTGSATGLFQMDQLAEDTKITSLARIHSYDGVSLGTVAGPVQVTVGTKVIDIESAVFADIEIPFGADGIIGINSFRGSAAFYFNGRDDVLLFFKK